MRPIAPLRTELLVSGAGQLAIGAAGLVAGILLVDSGAARAVVPFAVAAVALAAVSALTSRWLRDAEPSAGDPGARIETTALTVRRTSVTLALAALAVAVAAVIGGGLAAVLGGVVAGVGAVDLANRAWVRARERRTGLALYRELGPSPFSSGRRPLYTLPRKDITLAT
ncbi:MAG TPA: hypothetical protein VK904_04880 [Miltoncostaeaceae bacterium]|nr:hypothetical protein [Miltoncostaeaceae bacterium]